MNSLRITGTLSVSGSATGTSGQPDLNDPVVVKLIAALTSSGSGATLANDLLYYTSRSLGTNETFDLTNFTSALTEAGSSMSKVRIYAVVHESTSAATSITVGNAATPFPGMLDTATTTITLPPNTCFLFMNPTSAGMTVGAGQGIKIVANGGTATYTIVVVGE